MPPQSVINDFATSSIPVNLVRSPSESDYVFRSLATAAENAGTQLHLLSTDSDGILMPAQIVFHPRVKWDVSKFETLRTHEAHGFLGFSWSLLLALFGALAGI